MSKTRKLVVADVGGTNARFAWARVGPGSSMSLDKPIVLATSDFADIGSALEVFCDQSGQSAPNCAAFALAGPVSQGRFKLTNNDWHFDAATLADELGIKQLTLLNDFAAVAHAIAGDAAGQHLDHIAGPDCPLPQHGTVTVIGPGTGLGIAHYRWHMGQALVQATEGAHIDFAPIDSIDQVVLEAVRKIHGRVSVERVLSGIGIVELYAACAASGDLPNPLTDTIAIWEAGLAGTDKAAALAVQRFVKTLGRIAGDYALAHGSSAVVVAGGIGQRLRQQLKQAAFHQAFLNKGRYRPMMEGMPIKLITHPQPGLLGAATAFAREHLN